MFKGWKHAVECSKCKSIQFINDSSSAQALDIALKMEQSDKSACCNAPYSYIGLRPERENMLKVPVFDDSSNKRVSIIIDTPMEPRINMVIQPDNNMEPDTIEETPAKLDVNNDSANTTLPTNELTLSDVFDTTRKMSGRYMTDIVRAVMEENNDNTQAKLNLLKDSYSEFFNDSLRYIPKFLKNKYNLA